MFNNKLYGILCTTLKNRRVGHQKIGGIFNKRAKKNTGGLCKNKKTRNLSCKKLNIFCSTAKNYKLFRTSVKNCRVWQQKMVEFLSEGKNTWGSCGDKTLKNFWDTVKKSCIFCSIAKNYEIFSTNVKYRKAWQQKTIRWSFCKMRKTTWDLYDSKNQGISPAKPKNVNV